MLSSIIVSDPGIMAGTPCFRGTRVPLKNLLDYIEGGYPLAEFLEDFPTVSREMATEAGYEVLITVDQGIPYQQSLTRVGMALMVLAARLRHQAVDS